MSKIVWVPNSGDQVIRAPEGLRNSLATTKAQYLYHMSASVKYDYVTYVMIVRRLFVWIDTRSEFELLKVAAMDSFRVSIQNVFF